MADAAQDPDYLAYLAGRRATEAVARTSTDPESDPDYLAYVSGSATSRVPTEPNEGFNWGEFLDIIPGVREARAKTLKVGSKAIRKATRTKPGSALEQTWTKVPSLDVTLPSMAQPVTTPGGRTLYPETGTVDLGAAVNFLTGVPGNLISAGKETVGEISAQLVESLPEMLALPFMGKAAGTVAGTIGKGLKAGAKAAAPLVPLAEKAAPTFTAAAKELARQIPPALSKFGGMAPSGRAAIETMEQGQLRGALESEDLVDLMATATVKGVKRKLTPEEIQTVRLLMMQPGQREVMSLIETTPTQINRAQQSALSLAAQPHPSTPGMQQFAAEFAWPETDLPAKTMAQMAEEAAKVFQTTGDELVKTFGKDPQSWSRFMDGNYFPDLYSSRRLGTYYERKPIRERTGFFKTQRDVTPEKRFAAESGEAVGRVYEKLRQEKSAIAVRQMFDTMAADPAVTIPPMALGPEEMTAIAEMSAGQTRIVGGIKYTKLSSEASLGPLAGQMVKSEEAAYINQLVSRPGRMRRVLNAWWNAWKFGKTVQNPKTHIRNLGGNAFLADIEGLPMYSTKIYGQALRELKHGGERWKEARSAAAPWTVRRGRPSILDDVVSERELSQSEDVLEAFLIKLPRWWMSNRPSAAMAEAYQQSEALFKHALYIQKRGKGIPIHQAISEADAAIINYGNVPQMVQKLRAFPGGIPFITFTYGVTPILAKAALTKPQAFLRYKLVADAWNELAMEKVGMTDEEREQFQVVFPGTVPLVMPYRDASGSAMVFDVARFTPMSDFIPGRLDLPGPGGIMENIAGKSPVISELATKMTGLDPSLKFQAFPTEVPGAMAGAEVAGLDPETIQSLMGPVGQEATRGRLLHAARTALPAPLAELMNVTLVAQGKPSLIGEKPTVPAALIQALYGPMRSLDEARVRDLLALLKQVGQSKGVMRAQAIRRAAQEDEE